MVNRHGSKTVVSAFSNSKLFADFVRRKTNNKKRKRETDEKRGGGKTKKEKQNGEK